MELKAIETSYSGYRFRSRLEARWAVFFDHLGIPYEYEKEGYDLDGLWYLPDFWLPEQKVWIEIKATYPNQEEQEKASRLAAASGFDVFIFFGQIAPPENCTSSALKFFADFPEGYDTDHWWCECSVCGLLGVEFSGYSERLDCGHNDPKCSNEHSPRLMAAYKAARSERFGR